MKFETQIDKILNYMKQYVENIYEHDSEPVLNWKDLEILLDYITNLQEENEKVHKDFGELSEKYFFTKSRNEKALDKLYCYGEVFDSKILQEFQKEMENILNGGD